MRSPRQFCTLSDRLSERISPADRALVIFAVIAWRSDDGCALAVYDVGERRFRCQFFSEAYKEMGIGTTEHDDLAECAVALLQAQADNVAPRREELSER